MKTPYPYIHRQIETTLKKLFKQFPVVVVSGARQVGKSTLLEKVFPQIQRIIFDPLVDVENAKTDPELFLRYKKTPLILDEIQYVPQLVPALKRRLDHDRTPGQYLITSSHQWEVMKLLSESLAGRAVLLDLHSFCLAESTNTTPWLSAWLQGKKNFKRAALDRSLYEQLWAGFFPEAQFIKQELLPYFYQSYIKTYIEKDARMLANISDWQLFSRFYRLCASMTAQEINYSELGRDLGLTPQTATRWLDILKATFQWLEVPAFSQNTRKRVSMKAKGYFLDTGLVCASLAISAPSAIATHPQWGALFETAAVNEIKKQASLIMPSPILHHWRMHSGSEVDLILEWNGSFYPIEIKAKSHPQKTDGRGIQSFREYYSSLRVKKGLIVAPSENFFALTDALWVMPWDAVV